MPLDHRPCLRAILGAACLVLRQFGDDGSEFTADGTVTQGPAGEPLPWFAVRLEGGNVVVDPTETVPQGTYTPIE